MHRIVGPPNICFTFEIEILNANKEFHIGPPNICFTHIDASLDLMDITGVKTELKVVHFSHFTGPIKAFTFFNLLHF